MIKRFYVHNFRCFQNFELPVAGLASSLLIGNNGSGKSTVGFALEILQKIARGTNHVNDLIEKVDFGLSFPRGPMRFEIEVEIDKTTYEYDVAFERPAGSDEIQVRDERFSCDGVLIYSRDVTQVEWTRTGTKEIVKFPFDLKLIALTWFQEHSEADPLRVFKQWLAHMLILSPVPSAITGDSEGANLTPNRQVTNLGEWFTELVTQSPAAYPRIASFIQQFMDDFLEIKNENIGRESRSLDVLFGRDNTRIKMPFELLSDGEKCFVICALVLASNFAYGPLLCFWDEPDNYVSPSDVGHLVMALRREFENHGGQLVVTSHNPETIRHFPRDKSLLFYRKSHVEPTQVRPIVDIEVHGSLVDALIRNDVEP